MEGDIRRVAPTPFAARNGPGKSTAPAARMAPDIIALAAQIGIVARR
jgi:hypothetical protein